MNNFKEFFIDSVLASRLELVAKEKGISSEELLSSLAEQFLNRHSTSFDECNERRDFKRSIINIPSVVYLEENDGTSLHYFPASIRDVSPVGIGVVCSAEKSCMRILSGKEKNICFDLIFSFSDEMRPIKLRCLLTRVERVGKEIHIGALIEKATSKGENVYQDMIKSGLCLK